MTSLQSSSQEILRGIKYDKNNNSQEFIVRDLIIDNVQEVPSNYDSKQTEENSDIINQSTVKFNVPTDQEDQDIVEIGNSTTVPDEINPRSKFYRSVSSFDGGSYLSQNSISQTIQDRSVTQCSRIQSRENII